MKKEIFRKYDVRGIYPEALNENIAYVIGHYFGAKAKSKHILIGYDARLSSEALFDALVTGIIDAGSKPLSLGCVPSPLLFHCNYHMSVEFSIMVTASHNSKEYNGFKIAYGGGKPFSGGDIEDLMKFALESNAQYTSKDPIKVSEISMEKEYIEIITRNINIDNSLKIAWDLGNGISSKILKMLEKKLPNHNILLNSEIDGNFPSHSPDPTNPENIQELREYVTQNNCDFGIGIDGDGDRAVFVTSKGDILLGDQALLIFAKDILEQNPGSTVIAEVKTSRVFFDEINALGGKPIISEIGHPNIKKTMEDHKAILAGELSGHFFFKDKYIGVDDGIYAGLRMMDLITRSDKSLQEIYDDIPKLPSIPEKKIPVSEDKKFQIISDMQNDLRERGRKFLDIDGIRYENEHGFWLIRASNTEPILVTRIEGKSEESLEILKKDLDEILSDYGL